MREALTRLWKIASPDVRDGLAVVGLACLTAAAAVLGRLAGGEGAGFGAALAVLGSALFYLGVFHGRR